MTKVALGLASEPALGRIQTRCHPVRVLAPAEVQAPVGARAPVEAEVMTGGFDFDWQYTIGRLHKISVYCERARRRPDQQRAAIGQIADEARLITRPEHAALGDEARAGPKHSIFRQEGRPRIEID